MFSSLIFASISLLASTCVADQGSPPSNGNLFRASELSRRGGGVSQLLGHACRPIGQGVTVRSDQLSGVNDWCITKNVNSITPEYEMTWNVVEKFRNQFHWDPVDKIAQYAQRHGLGLRGHSLVGWETIPDWTKNMNKDEMKAAIEKRVTEVMHRYPQMESVVVVNEPMANAGSAEMRQWPFQNTMGDEHIATAFRAARAANPKVKLILNDFDTEGTIPGFGPAKRDGLYALVKTLLKDGVPIDVVGFESHFKVGNVPKDMAETFKMFTDLGVEVMVTEVDIRVRYGASTADYRQQALDFGEVYSVCMKNPKCTAVMSWNFDEDHSWLNPAFDHDISSNQWYQGWGSATIFGPKCSPKRWVMNSIIAALQRCH